VPHQLVLGFVRILELVHQDILVALLIALAHPVVLAEKLLGLEQEVVKIKGVAFGLQRLVALKDAGHRLMPVGGRAVGCGGDQLVLGPRDGALDRGGAVELAIQVELFEDAGDQALLVVLVIDHKAVADPQVRGLAAQDARAGGVKGANGQLGCAFADQAVKARDHLLRGLVGEGDGEDVEGLNAAHADQIGDAVGEHASLARSWPGQDQHRAFDGLHGLGLGGIQAL